MQVPLMEPHRTTAIAVGSLGLMVGAAAVAGLLALPRVSGLDSAAAHVAALPTAGDSPGGGRAEAADRAVPFLPALAVSDPNAVVPCRVDVAVQNLSAAPLKAVLVTFPSGDTSECLGPNGVYCSGLLAPGSSWMFPASQVAMEAASGAIFSFSPQGRQDLGLPGDDDIAADAMCEALRGLAGDCAGYTSLLAAYQSGAEFRGWPMDIVAAGPVGVEVLRRCPGRESPGVEAAAAYRGTMGAEGVVAFAGAPATAHVQNAGLAPVSVTVSAVGADCQPQTCPGVDLGPGQAAMVDLAACLSAGPAGITFTAEGPLAVVVEAADRTASVAVDAGAAAVRRLFAPLAHDPDRGWTTEVQLVSTESSRSVPVEAVLHLPGRDIRGSTTLCPGAAGTITFEDTDRRPGLRAGTLDVDFGGSPAAVAGWVSMSLAGRGDEVAEQMSYPLLPDPVGVVRGGRVEGGVGVVAVPLVARDLNSLFGATSEIAIADASSVPGWTEATILLYDQNDLVAIMCRHLGALGVDYLNFDWYAFLPWGFRGSAVISATTWSHPAAGQDAVGIAAVAVTRSATRLGNDVPGDEAMAVLAEVVPSAADPVAFAASQGCAAGGQVNPTPVVPPLPPTETAGAVGFLPLLRQHFGASLGCSVTLKVRNTRGQPAVGAVVFYAPAADCDDAPPLGVVCTGLIAPGSDWMVEDGSIPPGAASAVVYSIDGAAKLPGGEAVADRLCSLLAQAASGADMRRLTLAFRGGGTVDGVSLAGAALPGLDIQANRSCPDVDRPGLRLETAYFAVPASEDSQGRTWRSTTFAASDWFEGDTVLYAQNAGLECTDVEARFRWAGDCLRQLTCSALGVGPGETVAIAAPDCLPPDVAGSAVVHAREDLAVVAAWSSPAQQVVFPSWPGRLPYDVTSDGRVDEDDRLAVERAMGQVAGEPGWNQRLDLLPDGKIDVSDQSLMEGALCTRPPLPTPPLPEARPAYQVLVPLLRNAGDGASCEPRMAVQNLGAEATGVVVLFWEEPVPGTCAGPISALCSPGIPPGSSWNVPPEAVPERAASAIAFSFTTRPFDEVFDDSAHEIMCETLKYSVVGECEQYAVFKAAFDEGKTYAGVPQGKAKGSPIAVTSRRTCSAGDGSRERSEAVTGISPSDMAAFDPLRGGYVYNVPFVRLMAGRLNTALVVQNAGSRDAEVAVRLRNQDDCTSEAACDALTVPPGAAPHVQCGVGPDFQGSAVVVSSQPVGVVAETFRLPGPQHGPLDNTYGVIHNAVPAARGADVAGNPLPPLPATRAYAPLIWSPDEGWDVGVQVMNLDDSRAAQVHVAFRDGNGLPAYDLEDVICPAGSQTYFMPVVDSQAGHSVGSVVVTSVGPGADGGAAAAPIGGLVMMFRYSDAARSRVEEMAAYELLPEALAVEQPGATSRSGLDAGVGVVAIPGIVHDPAYGRTTEIAVSNLVDVPGVTDATFSLFDANGLVDVQCWRLPAGATRYADAAALRLPAPFLGAGLISATSWSHLYRGPTGDGQNYVGLGAALVSRDGVLGEPRGGDETAVILGVPLRGGSGDVVAGAPCPPSLAPGPVPTTSPPLTPPPAPTPTATLAPGQRIFLPMTVK